MAWCLAPGTVLADPFEQVHPTTQQLAEALRQAQQPADVPGALSHQLPETKLQEIPLADVCDLLRRVFLINVLTNYAALEPLKVDRTTPVTFAGRGLTGAQVVEGVLKPFAIRGVAYTVDKEALYISTKADLEALAAFRTRNSVVLAAAPCNSRLLVERLVERDPPNVRFDNVQLDVVLRDLSKRAGVHIRADEGLRTLGVDPQGPVSLQLRNPLLGDTLTAVLWTMGRIDDVDLQVKDNAVTIIPRRDRAN